MKNNIIGERIAGLLREQGKSQRKLAEQAGTTGASISRYIKGNRVPTGPVLANIAKALHTTTDYLLGYKQDSNDSDLEYNYIQRAIARNANRWSKKQKLDLVNALFENNDALMDKEGDKKSAKALSKTLKLILNSFYGMTSTDIT